MILVVYADPDHGVHHSRSAAHGQFYRGDVDRGAGCADRSRRRIETALGGDHRRRRSTCCSSAALIWILPLFPAEPKLGPVLNPVTQFVPPNFPLLLIVPAFAIDLVRRYSSRRWQRVAAGVVLGAVFFGAFCRRAMAVRRFSDVARGGQRVFRHHLSRLRHAARSLEARNFLFRARRDFAMLMLIALGVVDGHVAHRLGLGQLDANGEAMKADFRRFVLM